MASGFDVVAAAELLLEQAKTLMAAQNGNADSNEDDLRRSIAQTARRIAAGTAPPMDVVKYDWIVVSSVSRCTHSPTSYLS